jgi:hypothetical protein
MWKLGRSWTAYWSCLWTHANLVYAYTSAEKGMMTTEIGAWTALHAYQRHITLSLVRNSILVHNLLSNNV